MAIGTYLLITALNLNGLNSPTKTHRLVNGYKNKTSIYAVSWRMAWQPTPVFLPAEYHGWGPTGLQSMWLQRVRHN